MNTTGRGYRTDHDYGYAEPYATDGREVIKIGVKLNKETRNVEWYVCE